MSSVDTAITRLGLLAIASTSYTVKNAPSTPPSDGAQLPIAISHLSSGEMTANSQGWGTFIVNIDVDFYINMMDLREAYTAVDALAIEFSERLIADPTLDTAVSTITFPVSFDVTPSEYGSVPVLLLKFTVPVKTNPTSRSTST